MGRFWQNYEVKITWGICYDNKMLVGLLNLKKRSYNTFCQTETTYESRLAKWQVKSHNTNDRCFLRWKYMVTFNMNMSAERGEVDEHQRK